jgi:hypothetical protein
MVLSAHPLTNRYFPQTHGDFGGMHDWRPCTYPDDKGMCLNTSSFRKPLSLNFLQGNPPLSLYMGLISNSTVYGTAAGGAYNLTIDGAFAIATQEKSPSFYRDLFTNTTRDYNISMVLFEQDFLSYWFAPGKGPAIASSDAFVGVNFLRQQADAAASVGAHVQYCMNLPSSAMTSTLFDAGVNKSPHSCDNSQHFAAPHMPLPTPHHPFELAAPLLFPMPHHHHHRLFAAVSQAREAKDHVRDPLVYSWKAGLSGLLLWAVGLGSSVDNIFTGPNEIGCNGGFNCTEPNRRYEVTLAALSGGPFAIGDGIGFADKAMVMQSCMANGTLLRPDKQLTVTDGALRLSFDPVTELDIWSASSAIPPIGTGHPVTSGAYHVTYVLSTYLNESVSLSLADLGLDNMTSWVAFDRWSSLDGESRNYTQQRRLLQKSNSSGAAGQLTLRACPRHKNPRDKNWISTVIVPAARGNTPLFLGELDKVVSVSSIRFKSVVCGGFDEQECTVRGVGAPYEVLRLGLGSLQASRNTDGTHEEESAVVEKTVIVGADGRFCAVLKLAGESVPCSATGSSPR